MRLRGLATSSPQFGAEGWEAPAFGWREGLPAFEAHECGIGAQHRAIGQVKARRALVLLNTVLWADHRIS